MSLRQRIEKYISVSIGPAESRGDPPPVHGRSIDTLVEHLRRAYGLDESETGKLSLIRRGAIYACVTLRADMLSGLPIRLYRVSKVPAGRGMGRVDLRHPRARYGMPAMVGGRRLAEYGTAEVVESAAILDLLARPNQDWVGRQLIRSTETGLGLVGEAHWQLHRGESGTSKPSAMSWLKDSRLQVIKPGDPDAPENTAPVRTVAGWWKDRSTAGQEKLLPGEIVWMRYPDPDDPDYGALAPSGIASTAANAYHDAMASNRKLFKDGLRAAGAFVPPEDMVSFDWTQADEITRDVNALLVGSGNTHRTPVFPYRLSFEQFGITPKDAEFVALMDFAIEDTARAYRIPIEMVGGTRRTYQNAEVADVALWQRALEPESCWLADELSMKLVPAFGLDPNEYYLGFDLSGVVALQADENIEWTREREKYTIILTGLQGMGLGQIDPASLTALAVNVLGMPEDVAAAIVGNGPPPAPEPPADDAPTQASLAAWLVGLDRPAPVARGPEFGSDEHARIMGRAADGQKPHRARLEAAVRELMRRQAISVAEALATAERTAQTADARDMAAWEAKLAKAFGRGKWTVEFRKAWRAALKAVYGAAGSETAKDLGGDGFDPSSPAVIRAIERQAQSFATSVTDTTWKVLRARLAASIADGTANEKNLAPAVKEIMGDMMRSRPETIARTETHRAFGTGSRLAAEETGLALNKVWMSALDSRVREDHAEAHGQTVALEEDFEVGGASGPGPGEMGDAGNDVNCRCALTYERADKGRVIAMTGGDNADSSRV